MDYSSIPTRTITAISFAVDSLSDTYFLSALVVTLLIFFFIKKRFESSKNLIPVPWNLPLVGSFPWLIWSLYRSGVPLYEFLRQLKYKYGDIYGLNICGYLIVIVNEFQAVKKLFDSPYVSDRPELSESIKSVHRAHQGKMF